MWTNPSSAREQLGFNQTHMPDTVRQGYSTLRAAAAAARVCVFWMCSSWSLAICSKTHAPHIMNELLYRCAQDMDTVGCETGGVNWKHFCLLACSTKNVHALCVFSALLHNTNASAYRARCVWWNIRTWSGQLKCEFVLFWCIPGIKGINIYVPSDIQFVRGIPLFYDGVLCFVPAHTVPNISSPEY